MKREQSLYFLDSDRRPEKVYLPNGGWALVGLSDKGAAVYTSWEGRGTTQLDIDVVTAVRSAIKETEDRLKLLHEWYAA